MTALRYRRGLKRLLTIVACLVLITGCSESSRLPQEQSIPWPSKNGSGECGTSGESIFYAYHQLGEFEVWQWSGTTISKKYITHVGKHILSAAIGPSNMWMCDLFDEHDGSEFCLGDLMSGKVMDSWRGTGDGYGILGQGSQNGKYLAVANTQGIHSYTVKFGLVNTTAKSFDWAATLNSKLTTAEILQSLVPSNDGAYIGVAPWENGMALIDVANKKVLWTLKPELDANINNLVFSPDNKLIYAGGVRGLVYGVNVETGKIVSQWWANLSADEEYTHDINAIAVSPNGRFVAAGTSLNNGLVFLFSTQNGHRYILKHGGARTTIQMISFSPDSDRLATYAARQIKIWKLPEEVK